MTQRPVWIREGSLQERALIERLAAELLAELSEVEVIGEDAESEHGADTTEDITPKKGKASTKTKPSRRS